jgi:hypothetical protein
MPVYLRVVSPTKWAAKPDLTDSERQDARDVFALKGGDGLSLWRASTPQECGAAVAGIMLGRVRRKPATQQKVQAVHVLEIDESDVRRFGDITQTPGDCPIASVNAAQHVDLKWSQEQLHAFADYLAAERQLAAKTYRHEDVAQALRAVSPTDVANDDVRAWLEAVQKRPA